MNETGAFRAIVNDMYARDISKKIKSVKHDKMKKGLFIGGKAPYGYKISQNEKNKLVIDTKVESIVKRIFALAEQGISARQIAVELTDENIATPSEYANLSRNKETPFSYHWKPEVISHMLKNQVYLGHMVQGRMKKVNYKSSKCIRLPEENWIVVKDTHEAIIEKEVFESVQLFLAERKKVKTRTINYMLKGLVACSDCKVPMGVLPKGEKYYLRCRTYARFPKLRRCTSHLMRADVAEHKVKSAISQIMKARLDINTLLKIIEEERSMVIQKSDISIKIAKIEKSINDINRRIDRMYEDKLTDVLNDEDFKRNYALQIAERENLNKALQKLSCLQNHKNLDFSEIQDFLEINKFPKMIFRELIEKIEITEKKEIIVYTHSNSGS